METLIVHTSLLSTVWPRVAEALLEKGVTLFCNSETLSALPLAVSNRTGQVLLAGDLSYDTEYLDLKLSVITQPSVHSAIQFINAHSSHHTDTIVTESREAASAFCRGVDSAGTFINASTRFSDGFRYGFGTEVGISTGRIHARGPVGLEGLVTYKYMMQSKACKGHIVEEFGVGEGKKSYKHVPIEIPTLPL